VKRGRPAISGVSYVGVGSHSPTTRFTNHSYFTTPVNHERNARRQFQEPAQPLRGTKISV
jgi:hypothetical protein